MKFQAQLLPSISTRTLSSSCTVRVRHSALAPASAVGLRVIRLPASALLAVVEARSTQSVAAELALMDMRSIAHAFPADPGHVGVAATSLGERPVLMTRATANFIAPVDASTRRLNEENSR